LAAVWCLSALAADSPPPYPPPLLTRGALAPEELQIMDLALESIMLGRADLSFKKDYIDDPFRLAAVQRAMDDPLSLIDWCYDWDAALLAAPDLSEILLRMRNDLAGARSQDQPLAAAGDDRPPPSGIPAAAWLLIRQLDGAVANAMARMDQQVWASVDPADRGYLQRYLLCRFSRDASQDPPAWECPDEEAYGADPRFLSLMEQFPLGALLDISAGLADEVQRAAAELAAQRSAWTVSEPVEFTGHCGRIILGTTAPDVWRWRAETAPVILIDPDGNDVFDGPFGAAGQLADASFPQVCLVLDLAGDDTYRCDGRAQGSAALGIAVQFDLAGRDTYRAGNFSHGCGMFGVGLLVDSSGDDLYEADLLVQGAGACGAGILLDGSGGDTYRAGFYAQGFGYTRGFGLLADRDGYDCYYAGSRHHAWPTWGPFMMSCAQGYGMGIRPAASGGIGVLHDRNGKDAYIAEVFSQGGSYWYGIGALIDDAENDQYVAQVYSQGAGVHLATGILLDRGGDDNYSCDNAAQGFAHDYSVGWLIDEAGNDNYQVKGAGQGHAVTNSVAGIIDRSGNDGYFGYERGQGQGRGYASPSRGYGNIGLQIDMRGEDTYAAPGTADGGWWSFGSWFAGVDVPAAWWTPVTNQSTDSDAETPPTLTIPADIRREVRQ